MLAEVNSALPCTWIGSAKASITLRAVWQVYAAMQAGVMPPRPIVGVGGIRTGEDALTIEDVYEPFLLQLGFIQRTPRGRLATPAAYLHFGVSAPRMGPGGEAWEL